MIVSASDGEHEYQVPLALRRHSHPEERSDEGSGSLRPDASVVQSENGATLYDAVHDAAFRRGLANALGDGADGHRAPAASLDRRARRPRVDRPATPRADVGAAEQSNTSIVFGDVRDLQAFQNAKAGRPSRRRSHALSYGPRRIPQHAGIARDDTVRGPDGVTTSGMLQAVSPRVVRRVELRARARPAVLRRRTRARRAERIRRRRQAPRRDHARHARRAGERR